jgi:aldehyde dehydrogenase (NAD+)
VGEACGRNLILPSLDLVGKGSLVAMADADLDQAADDAVQAAFGQAGQRPTGLVNLLVHEACAAAFKQRLLDRIAALEVGNPLTHPDVAYGPMINARAAAAFREHWDLGLAQGATLLTGGAQWTEANRTVQVKGEISHGVYMQPCVWEGVTPDMGLFRHPVTGPTVNLCTFQDLGEALGWIADSTSGGTISLYTREPASIELFQRAGRTDIARVNTTLDDRTTLLSFTGHGTHSGCQPVLDGFTRWMSVQGEGGWASATGAKAPEPVATTLKTDWDSL